MSWIGLALILRKQESWLFFWQKGEINIGEKFQKVRWVYKVVGRIRDTFLLSSLIASIKGENAPFTGSIMHWFEKLQDILKVGDHYSYAITVDLMSNEFMKKKNVQDFCMEDICIEDLTMEEKTLDFDKMSSDDAFQGTIRGNHGEA